MQYNMQPNTLHPNGCGGGVRKEGPKRDRRGVQENKKFHGRYFFVKVILKKSRLSLSTKIYFTRFLSIVLDYNLVQ